VSAETRSATAARALLEQAYQDARTLILQLRKQCDAERVHDARVAARRLRTMLAALAQGLPTQRIDSFRRELRRMTVALAPARDAQVRKQLLVPLLRAERARSVAAQREIKLIEAHVRRTRRQAQASLRTPQFEKRLRGADRALQQLASSSTVLKPRRLLRQALLRHWTKLARALDSDGTSPDALHAMRIRVKKCRYLLEAYDRSHAHDTGKWLAGLQDCLGQLHDITQAEAWLKAEHNDDAIARILILPLEKKTLSLLSQLRLMRRARPSYVL
jgi:CHAD domain-containing protein